MPNTQHIHNYVIHYMLWDVVYMLATTPHTGMCTWHSLVTGLTPLAWVGRNPHETGCG